MMASMPAPSHAETETVSPASAPTGILTRTLSLGSTGPDVYALQEFLRAHGYFTYPTSTGFFGPVTEAAVIAFQRDNGIDPIGIVGPVTRAKIAELSSISMAPSVGEAATSTPIRALYGSGPRHHSHRPSSYTVGGTVSGLSGTGLILENNAGDDLAVAGNGSFTFDTSIASGGAYGVTVLADPVSPAQTCVVSDGSGTADADVNDVSVTCTTVTYPITPSGDGHESIAPSTPQTVADGSTQSFTVTADDGYTLSDAVGGTCRAGSWSGSVYTTGVITSSCTVSFMADADSYALTVVKAGPGAGNITSTPAGIGCGPTCSATYAAGAIVTLTAFATNGFFNGWSGGGCSGLGSCVVTMNAATTITAMFQTLDPS